MSEMSDFIYLRADFDSFKDGTLLLAVGTRVQSIGVLVVSACLKRRVLSGFLLIFGSVSALTISFYNELCMSQKHQFLQWKICINPTVKMH